MSVPNPGTPEPAKVDAAPATPPATPPAPEPKPQLLIELEKELGEKAPAAYQHIKELRAESKTYRQETKQLEADLVESKSKLAELEAKQKDAEEQRLKEQNDWKALYEREQQERKDALRVAQKTLIETALEAEAAKEGIHPKLLKLVDRRGIVVDGDGRVSGIKSAVDRFKEENGDLLAAAKPPAAAAATPAADPAQPPEEQHVYEYLKVPGTNMTYAQHARMTQGKISAANPGAAPAPKESQASNQPVDHRKLSKKESDDAFNKLKQKLGKR